MMKRASFAVANIYVPTKRRATLNAKTVQEIAESILQVGQKTPVLLRRDGDRFVLIAVTGYGQRDDHRKTLEAGFDVHLVKPVDPHRLNDVLALAARRATAEYS